MCRYLAHPPMLRWFSEHGQCRIQLCGTEQPAKAFMVHPAIVLSVPHVGPIRPKATTVTHLT